MNTPKLPVSFLAMVLCGLSGFANADGWIEDQHGCKHWNAHPQPGESVSWSGACEDGFASGHGELQWFSNNEPASLIVGNLVKGKLEGEAHVTNKDRTIIATYQDDNIPEDSVVTIKYGKAVGSANLVEASGEYKTVFLGKNGWINRTLSSGESERVYLKDGTIFHNDKEAAMIEEISQAMNDFLLKNVKDILSAK